MKKVQFFSDSDVFSLQLKVNEWLSENNRIEIIDSGITYANQYSFYILYSISEKLTNEPEELVEEQRIVIAADEILPGRVDSN